MKRESYWFLFPLKSGRLDFWLGIKTEQIYCISFKDEGRNQKSLLIPFWGLIQSGMQKWAWLDESRQLRKVLQRLTLDVTERAAAHVCESLSCQSTPCTALPSEEGLHMQDTAEDLSSGSFMRNWIFVMAKSTPWEQEMDNRGSQLVKFCKGWLL